MTMQFSLHDIARHIDARIEGDSNAVISSISSLANATAGEIAFLSDDKYLTDLQNTCASAVIVKSEHQSHVQGNALIVNDPYLAFAKVAQLLDTTPDSATNIAPSAVIDPTVDLADNVHIGANVVIEAGATIKDNVQIGPGSVIGKNAVIGENTKLWANVTIYHQVRVGADCLIHAGTVIGADGFGYANEKGRWVKIPQLGTVVIGDRVEIGGATVIDRGALEDTIIEDGVIIDNLCHIAHNVKIGENTAMAATSAVAGSSTIGKHCTMAGRVGINGHIEVADNCHFSAYAMVTKTIKEPGVYSSGIPAENAKDWRKNIINLRNIAGLKDRVKKLEQMLKQLKSGE